MKITKSKFDSSPVKSDSSRVLENGVVGLDRKAGVDDSPPSSISIQKPKSKVSQIKDILFNKKSKVLPDIAPKPSIKYVNDTKSPSVPIQVIGEDRTGKSKFALKLHDALSNFKKAEDGNTEVKTKGKNSMLILLNGLIADIKMKEKCISCEYNHHFVNDEQRKALNEFLNRISFEHESSKSKRLFRQYKTFDSVDTICLSKDCPYGFFHGEKK